MDLPNFVPESSDEYLDSARIAFLSRRFNEVEDLTQLDAVLVQLPGFEGCRAALAGFLDNRAKMTDHPAFPSNEQAIRVSAAYYLNGVFGLKLTGNAVLTAIVVMLPEPGQSPVISFYMNHKWYHGLYTTTGLASTFGGQEGSDKIMMNAIYPEEQVGPINQAMRRKVLEP